jgi:hypothetical protein
VIVPVMFVRLPVVLVFDPKNVDQGPLPEW